MSKRNSLLPSKPPVNNIVINSLMEHLSAHKSNEAAAPAAHDHEADVCQSIAVTGLLAHSLIYNGAACLLYEEALRFEPGTHITSSGALATSSGKKTGRSPSDKRIVREETTEKDVWWGSVNIPLEEHSFMINRERAIDYLNTKERLYVVDGFAGWDPAHRIKIRLICSRAYHALFMQNMLIRPTPEELLHFGEPDYVIYNAGEFSANRYTEGMTSSTSVCINFKSREMVILGTEYAGEMKKGVFTIMHYLMPKQGVLSLHSSCNVGVDGQNATLFFGLSGTGKTTLSADPRRLLIGDDEHCWSDTGVFNIEGGCYAKCIGLNEATEPEIYRAVRFGTVVENMVLNEITREIDFNDVSITENTRAAYPIEFIPNAKIPCICTHPTNIILLTCDAFGVLPPVSKLSTPQAMYHFISGYTAKVAGTEMGITEPQATFSTCFAAPFIVWHPTKYAEMLAEKMQQHNTSCWLVNTGWTGGKYGVGSRMKLKYSRAMIDAIHDGSISASGFEEFEVFGFQIPKSCPSVPAEVLNPRKAWADTADFQATLRSLAGGFIKNFAQFAGSASPSVLEGAPKLSAEELEAALKSITLGAGSG